MGFIGFMFTDDGDDLILMQFIMVFLSRFKQSFIPCQFEGSVEYQVVMVSLICVAMRVNKIAN